MVSVCLPSDALSQHLLSVSYFHESLISSERECILRVTCVKLVSKGRFHFTVVYTEGDLVPPFVKWTQYFMTYLSGHEALSDTSWAWYLREMELEHGM